jgi:hypothetical protein
MAAHQGAAWHRAAADWGYFPLSQVSDLRDAGTCLDARLIAGKAGVACSDITC